MALRLLISDALWSKIEPVPRELKHAACIDERTGVSFELSGGERHDATGFEPVWEGVAALPVVISVVMDKAYDSNAIRRFLAALGIEAVISPRANRRETIHHDTGKYKMREKIERLFNKLKTVPSHCHAIRQARPHVPGVCSSRGNLGHDTIIRQHGLAKRTDFVWLHRTGQRSRAGTRRRCGSRREPRRTS